MLRRLFGGRGRKPPAFAHKPTRIVRLFGRAAKRLDGSVVGPRQRRSQSRLSFGVAAARASDDAGSGCKTNRIARALASDDEKCAPQVGVGERNEQPSAVRFQRIEPGQRKMGDAGIDDNRVDGLVGAKGEAVGGNDFCLPPSVGKVGARPFREAGVYLERGQLAPRSDDLGTWLWIELGDLWETRGSLAEAAKAFFAARDTAARGGNDRDLAASSDRLGYMQVKRGDLTGALKSYKYVLKIAERLAKSDPGNWKRQRDLAIPYQRIGKVQVAQGDLSGALKSYSDSLAIKDRLAQSDPTNVGWQDGLSLSYEQIGDVLVAQGDLAGGLASYRDSLVIRGRLAKSDFRNAGWQRDLAVSNAKVGDVEARQGDLAKAMTRYRESLAIFDRLTKSDPGNAGWQQNLSVSYEKIGDMQVAQGDLAGALTSYRDSLVIRERLSKADPANAEWQRDLAVSHSKIANLLKKGGKRTEALEALQRAQLIMVRLTALSPDNAGWKRDFDWFEAQIAELSQWGAPCPDPFAASPRPFEH
jgi:tetratricopeptide (TPR) repeat protein